MELGLKGRKALITGASKGIGAAIARSLAAEGCNLALTARSAAQLETLCSELTGAHGIVATAIAGDLREPAQIDRLISATSDTDILINNAGDIPGGSLEAIDDTRWRTAWDLKVMGYINLARAFYTLMKQRNSGTIINVIGAAGERMDANYIAGSTGNAALYAFTRALGGASMNDGIRVVGVSPGPVQTERIEQLMRTAAKARLGDSDRYDELMQGLPAGRAATPREIADVVAFAASTRASYISGTVITVDGGLSANPSSTFG
ncbi:MAG: SDR family oxidoreductase [Novosphingobium sp.]|nr:SDR family oxidoreductase [Novosphingobium sp.]